MSAAVTGCHEVGGTPVCQAGRGVAVLQSHSCSHPCSCSFIALPAADPELCNRFLHHLFTHLNAMLTELVASLEVSLP